MYTMVMNVHNYIHNYNHSLTFVDGFGRADLWDLPNAIEKKNKFKFVTTSSKINSSTREEVIKNVFLVIFIEENNNQ